MRPAAITFDVLMGRALPPPVVAPQRHRAVPESQQLPPDPIADDTKRRRDDIAAFVAANQPVTSGEISAWAEIPPMSLGSDLRALRMQGRIRKIGRTTKMEGQDAIWGTDQ